MLPVPEHGENTTDVCSSQTVIVIYNINNMVYNSCLFKT